MRIDIMFTRNKPFQDEDLPLIQELQSIGLEIGWDYAYTFHCNQEQLPRVKEILKRHPNRAYLLTDGVKERL